jgi:low affinity Fe/Cu permease
MTAPDPILEPTQSSALEKPPGSFLKFANWVSEAMGKPVNIVFWFVLVAAWTLVFALGGRHLASGTWLPAWFTSTGFNFPLNLITTVAELFIGFLVAAAANRAQDALTVLLAQIRAAVERDAAIEQGLREAIAENTELTRQVHELQVSISQQTGLLDEIHRHVGALTPHAGLYPAPPPAGPAPG